MLEDYIKEQLEKLYQERDRLHEKLKSLTEEENMENEHIRKLYEEEDVGVELFSPRNPENKVKEQIKKIRYHIDEIQFQQADLTRKIELNNRNILRWEKLLNAGDGTEEGLTPKTFNDQVYQDDMQEVLRRLVIIEEAVSRDPREAAAMIGDLKYYIKALLTDRKQ